MRLSKIWLVITVLYFIMMAMTNLICPCYLRKALPNIVLAKPEGGYIDGRWYGVIVPDAALIVPASPADPVVPTAAGAGAAEAAGAVSTAGAANAADAASDRYICRPVTVKDFWTVRTYCSFFKVEAAAHDEEVARTAVTNPGLTDRDMIIIEWDKPLSDGCRIFILP